MVGSTPTLPLPGQDRKSHHKMRSIQSILKGDLDAYREIGCGLVDPIWDLMP